MTYRAVCHVWCVQSLRCTLHPKNTNMYTSGCGCTHVMMYVLLRTCRKTPSPPLIPSYRIRHPLALTSDYRESLATKPGLGDGGGRGEEEEKKGGGEERRRDEDEKGERRRRGLERLDRTVFVFHSFIHSHCTTFIHPFTPFTLTCTRV